jgi:peptidoglycan hydrolase CwlO-like protein
MNSWAELGKAALDVLGKSAPWVVIACLAAFGIYKLQELNEHNLVSVQAIAEKERNQARDDFSVANKALKDTYEAANKLYTEMIDSVGTSLKQLQQLETEVREKQKVVFESQVEAERTKARLEIQKNELDRTQERVTEVKTQLEEALRGEKSAEDAKKTAEASVEELRALLENKKSEWPAPGSVDSILS